MNLTSLVWFVCICLTFQWHMDDQLMALGAERVQSPLVLLVFNYDAKFKEYCHLIWQVVEKCRAQRVFVAQMRPRQRSLRFLWINISL